MMAGQRITYWKARKQLLREGQKVQKLQEYYQYLHKKFEYPTTDLSKEDVKKELKESWKNLWIIQKEFRSNRQTFVSEIPAP